MERFTPWIWPTISSISSLSFNNRFPTLGTSHLLVFTHLGLSPISSLFLFWNLGQITSTFRLKLEAYPPCLCYPHHAYPSMRITWKYRITSDTLGPLARTTSIFDISPFALYPMFISELLLFYLDLSCLWSTVIITLTIWSSLNRLHFLLILCSS